MCLGNICRSPAAEGVFLNLLRSKNLLNDFQVDSAGTGHWHIGKPADRRMIKAAEKRGIYLPSVARQILIKDLDEFDLILTMDNDNFETVKSLEKSLGRIANAKIRPMLSYSKKTQCLDVPDPYYGGERGFDDVLDLLEDACKNLLNELISRN